MKIVRCFINDHSCNPIKKEMVEEVRESYLKIAKEAMNKDSKITHCIYCLEKKTQDGDIIELRCYYGKDLEFENQEDYQKMVEELKEFKIYSLIK